MVLGGGTRRGMETSQPHLTSNAQQILFCDSRFNERLLIQVPHLTFSSTNMSMPYIHRAPNVELSGCTVLVNAPRLFWMLMVEQHLTNTLCWHVMVNHLDRVPDIRHQSLGMGLTANCNGVQWTLIQWIIMALEHIDSRVTQTLLELMIYQREHILYQWGQSLNLRTYSTTETVSLAWYTWDMGTNLFCCELIDSLILFSWTLIKWKH